MQNYIAYPEWSCYQWHHSQCLQNLESVIEGYVNMDGKAAATSYRKGII